MSRVDYALFDGDRFVTNALLDDAGAARMEREGWRCVRVETIDAWKLPAFRGRRYVTGAPRFRRGWDR